MASSSGLLSLLGLCLCFLALAMGDTSSTTVVGAGSVITTNSSTTTDVSKTVVGAVAALVPQLSL
jgi:hypothetical protein